MSEQEQTYTLEQIGRAVRAWVSNASYAGLCANDAERVCDEIRARLLPRFYPQAEAQGYAIRDSQIPEVHSGLIARSWALSLAESIATLLNAAHEAGTLGW